MAQAEKADQKAFGQALADKESDYSGWYNDLVMRAELAEDLSWREVFDVSVLGGVGFTVALLVAELAFDHDVVAQEHAKTAVLVASLLAAVLAAAALRVRTRRGGYGPTQTTTDADG